MTEFKFSSELVPHDLAVKLMEERVAGIINGSQKELVWFLEHESVFTGGTSAIEEDLISNEEKIPIFKTGRGGKYTYHGPGQRVVYVMLDLKKRNEADVRGFVLKLEKWLINSLKEVGVEGKIREGRVGVWVEPTKNSPIEKESKIAAIGIRIKKWVSFHGVAINVYPDLKFFNGIIPCGISDFGVTSLKELGYETSLDEFDQILLSNFKKIF